jgi:hypothetical protein
MAVSASRTAIQPLQSGRKLPIIVRNHAMTNSIIRGAGMRSESRDRGGCATNITRRAHALASRCAFIALVSVLSACTQERAAPTDIEPPPADTVPTPPSTPPDSIWDIDTRGVPPLIVADYIDLSAIGTVSRFRSSIGHDYSDAFETCRSMKHYFVPRDQSTAATIRITAPVSGTIVRIFEEWAGSQIQLRPDSFPAFTVILFHVQPATTLKVGDRFRAGDLLGTHVGSQTFSDATIAVNTPGGFRLVSYIQATTDAVWTGYQARGAASREQFVITRADRDRDPLTCDGEAFVQRGSIPDWVTLN